MMCLIHTKNSACHKQRVATIKTVIIIMSAAIRHTITPTLPITITITLALLIKRILRMLIRKNGKSH